MLVKTRLIHGVLPGPYPEEDPVSGRSQDSMLEVRDHEGHQISRHGYGLGEVVPDVLGSPFPKLNVFLIVLVNNFVGKRYTSVPRSALPACWRLRCSWCGGPRRWRIFKKHFKKRGKYLEYWNLLCFQRWLVHAWEGPAGIRRLELSGGQVTENKIFFKNPIFSIREIVFSPHTSFPWSSL